MLRTFPRVFPRVFGFVSIGFVSILGASLLAGCSGMTDSVGSITIPEPVGTGTAHLGGEVYGGQAPLVGSHVYALSSSVVGNGGPGITGTTANVSKSLIAATPYVAGYTPTADASGNYYITTDSAGFYEISSATTCTPGSITYLYSVQGNGGGGNNTAAGEMVALGVCPVTGTGAGTLAGSLKAGATHIHMNEISTIAAAFALAGYASDATHIGAAFGTASGTAPALAYADTLAVTGIHNAVNNAAQLYNYNYSTAQSGAGDPGAIANATTPNGNGIVPQRTLDSLGNSLGGCVNVLATSTGCTTLLGAALSGGTTGTRPTDTATAAINIAHNPAANVAAIYNNSPSTAIPFGTTLSAVPNDWSLSLVFSGSGLTASTVVVPHSIAVDTAGDVYMVSPGSVNSFAFFTPLGVPTTTTNTTYLLTPYSVALDITGSLWLSDESTYAITKYVPSTAAFSAAGKTQWQGPHDVEFDANGMAWIASDYYATINQYNPATGNANTATVLGAPSTIAIQSGTNASTFIANSNYAAVVPLNSTDTSTSGAYSTTANPTNGIAVDASGRGWATETTTNVAMVGTSGAAATEYALKGSLYNTPAPDGIAIDGSSNLWITDTKNGTLLELNNSGAIVSGSYGYVPVGNLAASSSSVAATSYGVHPAAVAVDGSGDVWYATLTDATLREVIGIATPVATPLVYGAVNGKLGQRP